MPSYAPGHVANASPWPSSLTVGGTVMMAPLFRPSHVLCAKDLKFKNEERVNIEEDENKTDVTIWSHKGVTLQHKFHLCLAKPVINERCSLRSEGS